MNGEVIATISSSKDAPLSVRSADADDDWDLLATGTKTISWTDEVTVVVLATLIAACFTAMGVPAVITAMGQNALSAIAGAALNAGVYMETNRFLVPPIPATYRYMWTVKPSGSSKTYGPYYYTCA